jgi:hypothetical protein
VPEELSESTAGVSLQSFDAVPGPKALPLIGSMLDYFKKDGLSFSKMFEVSLPYAMELQQIQGRQNIKVARLRQIPNTGVVSSETQGQNSLLFSELYPLKA